MPVLYGGENDPVQRWMEEWLEHLPRHVLSTMVSTVRSRQAITVQGVMARLVINSHLHLAKRAAQELLGIFGHD